MDAAVIKGFLDACQEAKRITVLMPKLPPGMTARHIYIVDAIRQLEQTGEPVRVRDISDYLDRTGPSITKLLQELESLGAVEKRPDPGDKRAVRLRLTELGQRYWHFYVEQYQSWLAEQLAGICPEDFQMATETIHRAYQVMRCCKMEGYEDESGKKDH